MALFGITAFMTAAASATTRIAIGPFPAGRPFIEARVTFGSSTSILFEVAAALCLTPDRSDANIRSGIQLVQFSSRLLGGNPAAAVQIVGGSQVGLTLFGRSILIDRAMWVVFAVSNASLSTAGNVTVSALVGSPEARPFRGPAAGRIETLPGGQAVPVVEPPGGETE